jgi:hypothetical protein
MGTMHNRRSSVSVENCHTAFSAGMADVPRRGVPLPAARDHFTPFLERSTNGCSGQKLPFGTGCFGVRLHLAAKLLTEQSRILFGQQLILDDHQTNLRVSRFPLVKNGLAALVPKMAFPAVHSSSVGDVSGRS